MKRYFVVMLGLCYDGYRGGRRSWTAPDCAKKYDEKSAARIAASLRSQGFPVQIREAAK
jgi:hypothetical protein